MLRLVGLYVSLVVLAFIFRIIFSAIGPNSGPLSPHLTTLALDCSLFLAVTYYARPNMNLRRKWDFNVSAERCLIAIAAGILSANASIYVASSGAQQSSRDFEIISFILTCVIAPVLEEVLFRGIILEVAVESFRMPFALIATSAIFASFHAEWLPAFIGGIVLGLIYLCPRRSLSAAIVAHVAGNLALTSVGGKLLFALHLPRPRIF